MFKSILHCSVLVANTQKSLVFYHDILGLEIDHSRPNLDYPGAWLTIGKQQIHLIELPNPDSSTQRPEHGGHDRHIALETQEFDAFINKLNTLKISFSQSHSGRKAVFFRDPDGNTLEVIGFQPTPSTRKRQ